MSTFVGSPLKIELIGTGEQVGTWGDTTNNNFKALQEAITGSATLDFSGGNVTLTLSDSNALTNARNLRLVCTGATINSDLVLASGLDIEKLYLVQNDTSYTITVKRSGGDAGVAIPAGGKRFVFNNGTNVVEAININVSSGVSGTLPIANGGTNTTTTPTNGGVAYGTGTAYAFSTAGTSGYALISQGTGSAPTWQQVTNSNTASTIVARNASGDFSAGTITASLSGNATSATTAGSCSGNAATATALQTARTIGGVSFDGTANINLPGVNTTGDQDTTGSSASCSGNAATATKLATARTINNTSFDGSADITIATAVTNASNNADYRLALLPGVSTQVYNVYASVAAPTVNALTGVMTVTGGIIGNASTATALSTASGSAPSYSARAWVNFNGQGTTPGQNVSIRGSANVSTVRDDASGEFRINFSTSMPNTNYACVGSTGNGSSTRFAGPIARGISYVQVLTESQDGTNTDFIDNAFVVFA